MFNWFKKRGDDARGHPLVGGDDYREFQRLCSDPGVLAAFVTVAHGARQVPLSVTDQVRRLVSLASDRLVLSRRRRRGRRAHHLPHSPRRRGLTSCRHQPTRHALLACYFHRTLLPTQNAQYLCEQSKNRQAIGLEQIPGHVRRHYCECRRRCRCSYEINFNRYFYVYKAPRKPKVIADEILEMEKRFVELMKGVVA